MHFINKDNIPSKEELSQFISEPNNLKVHNHIITDAVSFLSGITKVRAIILMGSLAQEKGDVFSDIDLYVIVEEDAKAIVRTQISQNLKRLGEIIHIYTSMANKKDLIIYIKPFVKLELALKTFEQLEKSWRVGKRSKILYDTTGRAKEAVEIAKEVAFTMKKYESEIKNFALSLPSLCFIAAGYIFRGEIITSKDFIAWLRRNLMRVSGFLLGLWDEGTRRAEKRFPIEIRTYYNSISLQSKEEMLEGLLILLEWYSSFLVPEFERLEFAHALNEVPVIKDMITEFMDPNLK